MGWARDITSSHIPTGDLHVHNNVTLLAYYKCTVGNESYQRKYNHKKTTQFLKTNSFFFVEKNGPTCFFVLASTKAYPTGGERKKIYKKCDETCIVIGLSRQTGQWLRCEHFGQLFILQAAFEEFVLGQLTVIVFVHLGKYIFSPVFCRVSRAIRRTCT